MKKIRLITYPQSLVQADQLLDYADVLVFGQAGLAIRMPASFSREDQARLVALAHDRGKQAVIAVNGLLHNAQIEALADYLPYLREIQADAVLTGDPGLIQVMREAGLDIPVVWDTQTLNTSAASLNFWADQGAVAAVVSNELTGAELRDLLCQLTIPAWLQLYGAVGLQHSLRPYVSNYGCHFGLPDLTAGPGQPLYLSEPNKPDARYPLYEDASGSHIFQAEDLNLLPLLDQLVHMGIHCWSLNSLFLEENTYLDIVALCRQAATALEQGRWTCDLAADLTSKVRALHPAQRPLGLGFFPLDPRDIS
ncbi:MAG: peptidase U32 family protein [Eubacteriales bacterium]|nr:U32 family peptidase [Clostridiales bacterium]MDY5835719.1 peptidase U32 family protein [Eubacteriales bacterium]